MNSLINGPTISQQSGSNIIDPRREFSGESSEEWYLIRLKEELKL